MDSNADSDWHFEFQNYIALVMHVVIVLLKLHFFPALGGGWLIL